MGYYNVVLPEAFDGYIEGSPDFIRALTYSLLVAGRKDAPNGSSFAVTVDGREGNWKIWLSGTSRKYLESLPGFAHSFEAIGAYSDKPKTGAVGP